LKEHRQDENHATERRIDAMKFKVHHTDGRPGIMYSVVLQLANLDGSEREPPGDQVHDSDGHIHKPPGPSTVGVTTDSKGEATYNVPRGMEFQEIKKVTRFTGGSHNYSLTRHGDQFDITITGWPSPVAQLREVLMGSAGTVVKQMAATVLTDSLRKLAKLTHSNMVDAWTSADADNPHIIAGAFLVSLTISSVYANTDAAAKTALKGIDGILNWLEHRRHPNEPGYLLRRNQAELNSRAGDNWTAEPSLDEYSGLLLGLSWLRELGPRFRIPSPELMGRARVLWDGISAYLKSTEGWLVRPGARDLTARGPALVASAAILNELFGVNNQKPFYLSENVKDILNRTKQYYESCNLGDNGFKDRYAEEACKIAYYMPKIDSNLRLLDFAYELAPFLVDAITGTELERAWDVSDIELWDLFGIALGDPYAVDGGGYNAQIFDRNSLAAFWTGNVGIRNIARTRYTRPLLADRNGWRILTLAGNYLFSRTEVVDNLSNILKAEVGYFIAMEHVPNNLECIEGFVLGWCILCFVADIDNGIEWEKYLFPSYIYDPDIHPVEEPMRPRVP
jgi:hypothetical protein